jgi:hypothetical protein
MPKHPMPVAPVFQPEIAADAVHWAAHHHRRELYVGLPTVYTILGNKLAPWLAERYLARKAVDGQLADAPPTPTNAEGNLFQSANSRDPGAHGSFDEMARSGSGQWWASRHRLALGAAGAVAGAAAAALAKRG